MQTAKTLQNLHSVKLKKSLRLLSEQYKNYLVTKNDSFFKQLDKDAFRESVIQRFEVCFDATWKSIKKCLGSTVSNTFDG